MKLFNAIATAAIICTSLISSLPVAATTYVDIRNGKGEWRNDGKPWLILDGTKGRKVVRSAWAAMPVENSGMGTSEEINSMRSEAGKSWLREMRTSYYTDSYGKFIPSNAWKP